MSISHEDTFSIQGGVFNVSNEAFALEYEPYKRLQGQQDVFFKRTQASFLPLNF